MSVPISREDWTLLAIDSAKDKGLTPVQLQKALFLLGKELPGVVSDFYVFVPYNYGPFSREVYEDARALEKLGFLSISDHGYGHKIYAIAAPGHHKAQLLRAQANPQGLTYLEMVVTWVQSMTFSQLVQAIYTKYPEYRVNSVFQA